VEATSKKSRDIPGEVSDLGKITNERIEWRGAQFRILQIWGIMISRTLNRWVIERFAPGDIYLDQIINNKKETYAQELEEQTPEIQQYN
jgi:hypothetical protein